jgi:hypothetical protein
MIFREPLPPWWPLSSLLSLPLRKPPAIRLWSWRQRKEKRIDAAPCWLLFAFLPEIVATVRVDPDGPGFSAAAKHERYQDG